TTQGTYRNRHRGDQVCARGKLELRTIKKPFAAGMPLELGSFCPTRTNPFSAQLFRQRPTHIRFSSSILIFFASAVPKAVVLAQPELGHSSKEKLHELDEKHASLDRLASVAGVGARHPRGGAADRVTGRRRAFVRKTPAHQTRRAAICG